MDTMYPQVQNMIKERSWTFAKSTGIEFQELLGEANLIFCVAFHRYQYKRYKNNKDGSFSTFLYNGLNYGLFNYCLSRRRELNECCGNVEQIIDTTHKHYDPDTTVFWDMVAALSSEAQTMIDLCLYPPKALLSRKLKRGGKKRQDEDRITRRLLKHYLVDGQDWKHIEVEKTFHEIENFLKEAVQ